jgi:hypothetical protein
MSFLHQNLSDDCGIDHLRTGITQQKSSSEPSAPNRKKVARKPEISVAQFASILRVMDRSRVNMFPEIGGIRALSQSACMTYQPPIVPALSACCLAILELARRLSDVGKVVLPEGTSDEPLSNTTFHTLLRRMKLGCRKDELPAGGLRDGAGAHAEGQDRSGL